MPQTIELEIRPGRIVAVEAEGTGETERPGEYRELAARDGGGIRLRRRLDEIADDLKDILTGIAERIADSGPGAPDKITLELSAGFGTDGAIRLLGAKAEGGIKVSITWEKKSA